MIKSKYLLNIKYLFFFTTILIIAACASKDNPYQSWQIYKGDATGSSYSALNQINKENVDQLEVAWTYRTGDLKEDDHPRTGIETNPIIVDGIMYVLSPHLKLSAIDAVTGKEYWQFDPFQGERSIGKLRSVVYWEDEEDKRILFTAGNHLHALDAETGTLIPGFGDEGKVSLNQGLGRNPDSIAVRASSPGVVYQDLLILGSRVNPGGNAAPGDIRAYDIKTGEIAWTFHTIPHKGEPGYETWENISEKELRRQGGANNWAGMALDKERGIVYAPTGSPNYDFYGGDWQGKNLYANTLLALDAATGERIWHFQTIHHDIWDLDLPASPNLLTIEKDGEKIDVVAQVSKHGFTYVFNRETGEPIFPIEEKPVPQSNVPGEKTWPTQPFPTLPEPYARQRLTEDEVTNISPEARDTVLTKLSKYRNEGLFTPPGPQGTIVLPGTRGAARWGGAAHDPNSGILYINASELPQISTVRAVGGEPSANESLFAKGKNFYAQNCVSCHGMDRKGQPPTYPAIDNVQASMAKAEVLEIIKEGGSMMPAFATISREEEEAIIAYLFGENNDQGDNGNGDDWEQTNHENVEYRDVTSHKILEDHQGYPGIKPPWGTLNAIDLNSGEIKWKVPLGAYPELEEKGIPQTGVPSMGGPIATAGGLIFIAGTEDKKFRAFDKDSGELLWETTLPAAGFANPATYRIDGRQYVVIACGGGRGTEPGDYYVAFALPG